MFPIAPFTTAREEPSILSKEPVEGMATEMVSSLASLSVSCCFNDPSSLKSCDVRSAVSSFSDAWVVEGRREVEAMSKMDRTSRRLAGGMVMREGRD